MLSKKKRRGEERHGDILPHLIRFHFCGEAQKVQPCGRVPGSGSREEERGSCTLERLATRTSGSLLQQQSKGIACFRTQQQRCRGGTAEGDHLFRFVGEEEGVMAEHGAWSKAFRPTATHTRVRVKGEG